MNPQTTSLLALLFVSVGALASLIMLEVTGKTEDQSGKTQWIYAHRLLGYFFILILTVMLFSMISKVAGYQEELKARAVIHIVMSLMLIPLLGIKILLARRYPRHSAKLPFLGITIVLLSFSLTGITAGYYSLHKSNLTYTTLMAQDSEVLDLDLGKAIMNKKCSKCHSLERIYRSFKNDEGWTKTVNKMAFLDTPNIAVFDIKQVTNYLISQQKRRQENNSQPERDIGKTLVSQKCSICHTLDRVYGAKKNGLEWNSTVARMIRTMADPDFLSKEEQSLITDFLSKRRKKE
ncbi:MAG: hypothetical protein DSY50_05355 [Desulfobulbus sp.]|nr:MAG: hypothetical protein DSY50_05355 [Desulfobulbus sp.]RUM40062.1 MAG: hypothetical protein DSY70_04480 [Desulfobulbus sp.]